MSSDGTGADADPDAGGVSADREDAARTDEDLIEELRELKARAKRKDSVVALDDDEMGDLTTAVTEASEPTCETAGKLLTEFLNIRQGKLVKAASLAAADLPIDTEAMTARDRETVAALRGELEAYRDEHLPDGGDDV